MNPPHPIFQQALQPFVTPNTARACADEYARRLDAAESEAQIAREYIEARDWNDVANYDADETAEIFAQVARLLDDNRMGDAQDALAKLLERTAKHHAAVVMANRERHG